MTTALQFSVATDEGKKRANNEDAYFADNKLGLWFVADGMGGHDSGEVASAIVKDHVSKSVRAGENLTDAIQGAHHAVRNAGHQGVGTIGMGSTIVALKVVGDQYEIAWVGDSRAYLWNGQLTQLSHDHSLIQHLIDQDLLSKEDAKDHPRRHIITQSLGYVELENIKVESITGQFLRGQKILLCSDGLNDEVSEEQIADILGSEDSEKAIVSKLIEAALYNGGGDNVTVLLVSASEDELTDYTKSNTEKVGRRNILSRLREYVRTHKLVVFATLIIAIAVLLGSLMYWQA